MWAVSSNGGSSFTNVMNTIFFIHHKRHTQTHIPPQHILFLSVAGEDLRRGEKVSAVGRAITFNAVCGTIFETFFETSLNTNILCWTQNES